MPRLSIDYSRAVIYKICCKDPTITDCYVGSTTNLINRRYSHKKACNNPKDKEHNRYIYQIIRQYGGWDNWDFVVVEECSCESKIELHTRERYWIETLLPTLNKLIPTRSLE
jgi:hypothetical protein